MIRTLTAMSCVVFSTIAASSTADTGTTPVGQRVDHLNFVFSVTDPDATTRFYGDILGLKRIADIDFPGDPYMIRYMGGKSEIKFIVTGQDLPKMEGGVGKARGIRLLAFLLPESQRAGILERMKVAGLPEPTFTERRNDALAYNYRYGMTYDYDGNQIELVFLDDGAPKEKFDQVQMGCIVSDMAAMDKFLAEIIGAKPFVVDDRIHRYDIGASQVKFWQVNGDLPAWVGGPMDKIGMNLIQFIVPDVDAVRAEVVARGGKIAREPFALGQIATIMFVEGPDGILFEFAGPLAPRFRNP
jgi:catechol 2,3-dioxygenase-like lactoylglutathione lyase family enzyme